MTNKWLERPESNISHRQKDHRQPFQRDRARILHSAAFRRLQSKTQVMGSGQNDFYRTRLTHSLEAAQIGSGIAAQLRSQQSTFDPSLIDDSLIESLCLAHDIGHPPFGHGGEVALHYMMREFGGFEGNGQTFRIVSLLEPFSEHFGMNLTRRTLLGLVKYPQQLHKLQTLPLAEPPANIRQLKACDWHPPKGLYQDDIDMFNWVLAPLSQEDKDLFQQIIHTTGTHAKTRFKSLDCSIMELADDIAYGIHDLEDAIVSGVVNQQLFEANVIEKLLSIDDPWLTSFCKTLAKNLFDQRRFIQKDTIGAMVNFLVTAVELVDINQTEQVNFHEPLLRYNASHPTVAAKTLQIFKDFVFKFVIKQPAIQQREYRGQQIVMTLFDAISSDPERLLPSNTAIRWKNVFDNKQNHHRVIADYISSMTDDYATKLYQRLFLPLGSD